VFASHSHVRELSAGLPRPDHLEIYFVFTTKNWMKCLLNWTPLNTHVRFEQAHLLRKVGLGFIQMNVRIQWNPVYKANHRIRLCGNEQSGS